MGKCVFEDYRFLELRATCAALQPEALRFSDAGPDIRWCGNENGFGSVTTWCKVRPEGFAPGLADDHDRLPRGDADGTVWRPSEVDVSIRPGWFWQPTERPRSSDELFRIWLASIGQNSNLLLNLTPDRRGLIPAEDIAALAGMRAKIEAFTALDLAHGKPITASNTAAGAAQHLVDGDRETLWAATTDTAIITINLGHEERLGANRLEEVIAYGQRVSAFNIEVQTHGGWCEVARGTTIGAHRIVPLPQARGGEVRLKILAAQAAPVLSRIQVYAASA